MRQAPLTNILLKLRTSNANYGKTLTELKIPVEVVDDGERQHPLGPVFYADYASYLVAVAVFPHVLQPRPVEVAETLLDQEVAVREQPVHHGGVVCRADRAAVDEQQERGRRQCQEQKAAR